MRNGMLMRVHRDTTRQLAGFNAFVQKVMDEWNVPGLAIAVLKDATLLFSKGFGQRSVGEAQEVNTRTLFPIGSCTKAFTTAMMGILVDQGQLDWDRPVKAYLPDFTLYDPEATAKLTPRDLVTHRT